MHKLDRTLALEPPCLAGYDYRRQTWDDVIASDKEQIRASLEQLQDVRCAYCEGPVYSDGHIEHFRRKNQLHFPELTFVWPNLFLSCGSEEHCGHYKDRPGEPAPYDPDEIVKPDDHDPDLFFYFHSYGEIRPRSGIGQTDLTRAQETLRVFNLNCGALAADRRRAMRLYEQRSQGILEALMGFDEGDRQEFIAEELRATQRDPHWTVIRHYFEKAH